MCVCVCARSQEEIGTLSVLSITLSDFFGTVDFIELGARLSVSEPQQNSVPTVLGVQVCGTMLSFCVGVIDVDLVHVIAAGAFTN